MNEKQIQLIATEVHTYWYSHTYSAGALHITHIHKIGKASQKSTLDTRTHTQPTEE